MRVTSNRQPVGSSRSGIAAGLFHMMLAIHMVAYLCDSRGCSSSSPPPLSGSSQPVGPIPSMVVLCVLRPVLSILMVCCSPSIFHNDGACNPAYQLADGKAYLGVLRG